MSYYYDKYEFMGQDSAGFRGGEVEFQVSEFFEPMGMSRRILPWARIDLELTIGLCAKTEFVTHTFSLRIGSDSDFRRNIPIGPNSRYRTRCAQVGCSARARARPRAREPSGSDVP